MTTLNKKTNFETAQSLRLQVSLASADMMLLASRLLRHGESSEVLALVQRASSKLRQASDIMLAKNGE